MSLLYAVNMYFQSFGALSIVKINAHWFHVRERGVFGGVFGIMISCGYFLAMTVGGWILAGMSWYWVFLVPSMAIAAMFAIDYFVAVDTPKDAGFPDIDTGDATSALGAEKDTPVNAAYLIKNLYSNPVIVTITAAEFCTGFVRQGLMLWFVPFLKEVHGIAPGTAMFSWATGGITLGGIAGGLLCGWMSDALFQSRRAPVAFIFYIGQIGSLLWLGHTHSSTVAAFLIGFSCMWIFGVHGMLSGTASMDFGGTKAAGTAAGLMDGVQYLASGLTGFLLGGLLDKYGWGVWTWSIIPFSAIGAVLMLTLWNATPLNTKISVKTA
jgi:OPA family glycerol-3-phosphate transporter-like MFS transporter